MLSASVQLPALPEIRVEDASPALDRIYFDISANRARRSSISYTGTLRPFQAASNGCGGASA